MLPTRPVADVVKPDNPLGSGRPAPISVDQTDDPPPALFVKVKENEIVPVDTADPLGGDARAFTVALPIGGMDAGSEGIVTVQPSGATAEVAPPTAAFAPRLRTVIGTVSCAPFDPATCAGAQTTTFDALEMVRPWKTAVVASDES